MTKTLLQETATGVTKSGNRWRVVVAAPGQGMSGYYTKQVLKEQGPNALPPGTKAWIGHAPPEKRDPRDQLGKYPNGAWYDDNYDLVAFPEGALIADLEVYNKYKDMIEDIADEAELSIFMDGDKDAEGNVISMLPGRANSVDLVAYGGLVGSGLKEKLYETYRLAESVDDPSGDSSALDTERKGRMEKELKDVQDALTALTNIVSALVADKTTAADAAVDAEAEAKAEEIVGAKVDEALAEYETKVAAIEAAELLPSQVESLKAEARKGNDVTALIESAKAVVNEAKGLRESYNGGFRISESDADSTDFTVTRWN